MLKERIMGILSEMFEGAREDSLLLDDGIIDSFGILDLIDRLESEFGIQMDGEDIIPENFKDVSSIIEMIHRYIGGF